MFRVAEKYFSITLAKAENSITDKAKVYEKKIHFYSNLTRFNESYEAGRSALKLFKINLRVTGRGTKTFTDFLNL